uniref:Interferon alpha/beta receptor 1a-like n=1 Tax=Sinocyclocheilus rhinocerous TaxID=307959 RepID=A0A673ICC1_9TELE
ILTFNIIVMLYQLTLIDLRRPENVSVDSLNTRYVLRWDWPHETAANQTVTFTAQYLRNEKYWTSVCVNVLEHRCDFTGAIHYKISFLLRVWANTSQQSSGWVQISFCPDEHGELSNKKTHNKKFKIN